MWRGTEAESIEQALGVAEARLRAVVGHAAVILFAFDAQGRFTFGEGRGLEALGLAPNQLTGQSIFEVYRDAPQILEHVRRALRGEVFSTIVDLPGSSRSYETRYNPVLGPSGEVVEVIGLSTDITERRQAEAALKRSEAQLIEADRLASLGTLAAGVAHEINNPLSYVLLNLDLILRTVSDAARSGGPLPLPDLAARLHEARGGVERVRLIVRDLKAFSRVDNERREPVDVRRVLDSTIELAGNEIRHRARLIRTFDEVPPTLADPSRLGQVFLNLLVNAVQAMGEGDPARSEIRVRTRKGEDGGVVVEIEDNGAGISQEVASRIFEPFFTTKPAGVGTGLGLSICHGIITSLGGEIELTSELGRGTTFRVTLPPAPPPSTDARPGAEARVASSPSVRPAAMRGRVLVVDDEVAFATALGRSLEDEWEVTVISSSRDALHRLLAGEHFDAILCDLVMPGMTGMDLYDQLAAKLPDTADRVIFMTGGTFTPRARDFLAMVPNPTLDKPFDLKALEALLRSLLGLAI